MLKLYLFELSILSQLEEKVSATSGLAIIELIRQADPIVKLTILILLLFSVFSWAVMAYKYISLSRARGSMFEFSRKFWGISSAQELKMLISREANSAARVVVSALKAKEKAKNPSSAAVERAVRQTILEEISAMERFVPLLATVGNVSPFVGLFGTVWGIMHSFHEIGKMGTASLAVVAPGISEALIATAIGLFAAIPAVIGYNYFVNKIRVIATELEGFGTDLINSFTSGDFFLR